MKVSAIMLVFLFLLSCGSSSSVSFKVGDTRSLQVTGPKNIVVPKTKAIFDRTMQLAAAGDDKGIAEQVASGDAWLVEQYTRVKIINVGPTVSEVRFESGTYDGKSGFVPNEFVK